MGGLQLVELISGCSPQPLFSEEETRGYERSCWVGEGLCSGFAIMKGCSLKSGTAGECISDTVQTSHSAHVALRLAEVFIT